MTADHDVRGATSATASTRHARPMTGAEYLESIDDDRVIFIYGERVKKTTEHPAFRNTARMLARLYDALHDPARNGELLVPTDTGSGGVTHAYFRAPRTAEEALAGRNAIAAWQRLTYGWLGRSPDYKAAFLGTLGANSSFYTYPEERPALVHVQPGTSGVRESRHHPSADRPRPAAERDRRRLRAGREGNGCRYRRLRAPRS